MAAILTTPHFDRQLKSLDTVMRRRLQASVDWFITNPKDPRLHVKKLSGRFQEYWSFRVGHNFRVMFRPLDNARFLFLDIDDRKEIYR